MTLHDSIVALDGWLDTTVAMTGLCARDVLTVLESDLHRRVGVARSLDLGVRGPLIVFHWAIDHLRHIDSMVGVAS